MILLEKYLILNFGLILYIFRNNFSPFIFDENSTTIKTNDYVDLKEGDLIEFQEEIWFVKNCQEKKVNKNRQFMKKPMKFSYIQIKR